MEEKTTSPNKTARILEDVTISTKMKLSALWASVMFCYIYGDFFSFFAPGEYMTQIMAGKIGPFPVTQGSLLGVSAFMSIPCVMVFLSLILKPKASRWTNIVIGLFYTVTNGMSFLANSWAFMIYFGIIESGLTLLIVWYAYRWPESAVNANDKI